MIKKLKIKFIIISMTSVIAVMSLMIVFLNTLTSNYLNRSTDEILELLSEGLGKFPEIIIPPKEESNDSEDQSPNSPSESPGESPSDTPGEEDSADESGATDTDEEENSDGQEDSDDEADSSDKEDEKPPEYIIISQETPFDSRYFTVIMTKDGAWIESDMKQIAAVSEEEAKDYAEAVFGTKKGQIDVYKYVSITAPKNETITSPTEGTAAEGEDINPKEENLMYIFLDCRRETSYQSFFMLMTFLVGGMGILIAFLIILLASGKVIKPMVEGREKQKRFITNASHEIKTPITIIDANAELIEIENGESEWTEGIKKQTKRLVSLTEKLVTLTRMEESPLKTRSINFSISDAVKETAEPYTAIATAKSKNFSYAVDEGVSYNGDEGEIRQLISILLDNAMKYTNDGGSIALSLKENAKDIKIISENTTSGIKTGRLNMLFERFYRSAKARANDSHGFGIGLSVAEAIVNSHKGKISAHSPDGISIIFTVTLFK